jgi:hypothetical protein
MYHRGYRRRSEGVIDWNATGEHAEEKRAMTHTADAFDPPSSRRSSEETITPLGRHESVLTSSEPTLATSRNRVLHTHSVVCAWALEGASEAAQ